MTRNACRLLLDPPASGAWNMAVDELLLDWAGQSGRCGWRFYGWEVPTLSLGYFQASDARNCHPVSQACPMVRRTSGGGAILHDVELTYSFVLPRQHPLAVARTSFYHSVHQTLIDVLADLGVETHFFGPTSEESTPSPQPFLCFERRSAGDLVLGDVKIAGSAQRRSANALLQHGSILLSRSSSAPELDGLNDRADVHLDATRLASLWRPKLAAQLELDWHKQPLSDEEHQAAATLSAEKYGSAAWNTKR